MATPRPIWVRQAEEAKLKSEADTTAAAKAAFDATFRALSASAHADQPPQHHHPDPSSSSPPAAFPALRAASADSDSDDDDRPRAPPGPVDPAKSSAAGPGIAGGYAGAPATFTVTGKDRDGRRVTSGGARVRVRVCPAAGVGGDDLEGAVRDSADGSYAVTYAVPRRGNYMVHVDLDGAPIMGSPFPVFFSAATAASSSPYATTTSTTPFSTTTSSAYPNMVNQTMPNMPNYAGSLTSGAFPSLLGLIPGSSTGASGGVVLQGVGASLGEICREHINGKCTKGAACKFSHPPQQLLMSVMAATTSTSTLGHAPMAPSAAAMAAAQAIMAAQALQAHAAKMQADAKIAAQAPGPTEAEIAETLKKTVQISNLSPLLTVEHLKQMFGYVGKVVDCTITDSKHTAYVEYTKPEEATAALALSSVDVGGRPLNVEMAKSLPQKATLANSNLPMMMQQAVQLQQLQFQQALMVQTSMAAQQTAMRAATMKNATEAAAARAAEISRKLKAEGFGGETVEEKDAKQKSRSPSPPSRRSKSRSRSPIKYNRSRRDRSYSPAVRRSRDHRSRSPSRSHYYSKYGSDRSYRDDRDMYSRSRRRESDRSRDHYSSSSRRNMSRSISPMYKKSRADSRSPKRQREETLSPSKSRRSARAGSRSPRRHKGSKSSPTRDERSSRRSRHSRSRSQERKHRSSDKKEVKKSEMQDDKKKSGRGSRGDKDERSVKDPVEENNLDTSVVAHKRSSSLSEDEMLNGDNGNHKKSRHDAALENDKRKNEDSIDDGAGMAGDKIDVDSPRSKSEKRSLGDDDDDSTQNHDKSRNSKIKTDGKKYDRDDSSRKDRKYRDESKHSKDKSSRHSSSRSHRSSRHSGEKHHRDATDQQESKESEEGARARRVSSSLDDPLSSDKKKVHKESFPDRKLSQSEAGSDSEGIDHDTEVRLRNALLEKADLVIQEDRQLAGGTIARIGADVSLPASKQKGKEEMCSTVSDINGQHGPEGDGALRESAI